MFITLKRHEREKQELVDANGRLTDAVLKYSDQGLFLLDSRGKLLQPVSRAAVKLFRSTDFDNVTLEKILAPLVSAKTLSAVRTHMTGLISGMGSDGTAVTSLKDIVVRLTNPEGSAQTAHYCLDFDPAELPGPARAWLVRVTDITMQVQTLREVEDLRSQVGIQAEVLRSVLQMGGTRFSNFVKKAEASMKAIAAVLKKPAREAQAFRGKLEETLSEVDRMRREAAAFKLAALERAARVLEDALHALQSRANLSGSDFLPLAVKLDDLYGQVALVKSLTLSATARDTDDPDPNLRVTNQGTQIIEAPSFAVPLDTPIDRKLASAPAGSLDNTLRALAEHTAALEKKEVLLESAGLHLVPPRYQSVIKNVAIQLIRNAIIHGIETPAAREAAGKALHGILRLDFRLRDDGFQMLFEDDGRGLNPEMVRATAVKQGVINAAEAARLRDREAIKLIFKSRFTTLAASPGTRHGAGMSLVRRHIHECGGKIALASLVGHETRFKITLPALKDAAAVSSAEPSPEPPAIATLVV